MKKYFVLVFLASALLTGCQQEDQRPENLLLGSWQKTKLEAKAANSDWTLVGQTCQHDDIEEYRPTGDWTLLDGPIQCTAGTGILRGTWKQEASGNKIIYTYEGATGNYESTVEELTESKLVLVQSTGQVNGQQIRFTYDRK